MGLRRRLTKDGHVVKTAENGQKALDVLEAAMKAFDRDQRDEVVRGPPMVVLLDLMMPVMDGFQFLKELRNHKRDELRHVRVLVMTAKELTAEDIAVLGKHGIVQQSVLPKLSRGLDNVSQLVSTLEDAVSGGF